MKALDHFNFCPRCGEAGLRRECDKSVVCDKCGFTLFTNVASAVGALIFNSAGELLLLRRAKDPRKGMLGAPGGFVDAGESIEEALRREVMEEVNLELSSMRYIYSSPNLYDFSEITYPTVDLFFVCEASTLDTLALPDGEALSIEFIAPGEVDHSQVAFPTLSGAIREYLRQERRAR